jgi:PAS domain S-box-containing protein
VTDRQREDVLGQNWFACFLPAAQRDEVRQRFEQAMRLVSMQGVLPLHYTHDILTRQGERRGFSWHTIPLRDSRGRAIGATSIGDDLPERQRAEKALAASEERLASIVNSAMDSIITVNDEQRIVLFNAAAERMFQCAAAAALGQPLDRFIPERFRAVHQAHIRTFGQAGITTRAMGALGAVSGRRATGEEFPLEASISQVEVAGQRLYTVILRDITERQQAAAALRESEERFRLMADAAPIMMWMSGPDKLCTYFNKGWLVFTGRTIQQELGNGWAAGVHRHDVQRCLDTYVTAFDRRQSFAMEYRLRRFDGAYRWILDTGVPRVTPVGDFAGYIGACVDITERQQAKEALQRLNAELEQRVQERTADLLASNASLQRAIAEQQRLEDELLNIRKLEAIGLLAGGIAHDFNNILTAIIGNISLAKRHADPDSQLFDRLAAAEQACHRATDLTRQLLTFSTGGAPIKRPVAMAGFIRDAATFALRGSNIRCEYAIPDALWTAEVDEGQMSQVMSNILLNAQQAMPHGGIIRVQAENLSVSPDHPLLLRAGKYVKVSIIDHGVGIPPEHLSKIFDPYFTTKPHGSGLGLATAYAIMQKHAGYIVVESTVGGGTTFFLYIPTSAQAVLPPPAAPAPPQDGTGKILVMDDDAAIRELVQQMLTQIGYTMESACDGREAIALYTKAKAAGQPFDAVIMDLTIPGGLGGKETIRQLQELEPQIKAIVSSGYSTDPIMANFRDYGFCGVVAKPYTLAELSTVLHEVLAGRQAMH